MRVSVVLAGAVVALWGTATVAHAQTLTLEQVLERTRARAPELLVSLARVEEARARVTSASFRFRENPVLDVDIGPRRGSRTTFDYSFGIGQVFETGGQRNARIAGAEAEVTAAVASADEVARLVMRDVAAAFVRALGIDERLKLLAAADSLAQQLQTATERRYQAGDIPALDLNLTRIAAARAHAERLRAEADRHDALRSLRLAVGLDADAPLALDGSLNRSPAPRELLLAGLAQAPSVRRIDAEIEQARADLRLAEGLRRPDIGARVSMSQEQEDHILLGGLSFTLPTVNHGQAITAEANARVRRLDEERTATLQALRLNVAAGLEAYARRRAAAELLETAALPAADDNDSLGQRSLEAGEINLMNYLLIQQDLTAARLAHVDAQTDAALAAIDVEAVAGVLR